MSEKIPKFTENQRKNKADYSFKHTSMSVYGINVSQCIRIEVCVLKILNIIMQ